jgi:hypothetical protein
MKYFKNLFFIIVFSNVLHGAYLNDNINLCIDDYYVASGKFNYLVSGATAWSSVTTKGLMSGIYDGYEYDAVNKTCKKNPALMLGMDTKDFYFLLALIGVIFGGVFMFFSIHAFVAVGGKK